MILSYLKELQSEFLLEKTQIENRISDLKIQMKENQEFVRVLENETDSSYESFTPRELHPKNKEKLTDLKKMDDEINRLLLEEQEKYSDCISKLNELEPVLEEAAELKRMKEKKESTEKELEKDRVNGTLELMTVFQQIKLCSEIAEMDPHRCGVELRNIVKQMEQQAELFGSKCFT